MPIFSGDALNKLIADTLPNELPSGRTSAVVGMVDEDGVKVVVGVRLKDGHVEISGAYEHDWDGDDSGVAKVLLSW